MRLLLICQEYKDQLPQYLFGGLSPEEQEAVRMHLQGGCPRCTGALAEVKVAFAPLPLALTPAEPSASLREQLLAGVAADRPLPLRAGTSVAAARRNYRIFPWGVAIAASLAAFALGLWGLQEGRTGLDLRNHLSDLQSRVDDQEHQVRRLQTILQIQEGRIRRMQSPSVQVASLQGTPAEAKASGRIFIDHKDSVVDFVAAGLAPLPEGKAYQLWLIPPGKDPLPAGTFLVNTSGEGFLETKLASDAVAMAAVTTEPTGGSQKPTLPIRLAGKVEPLP